MGNTKKAPCWTFFSIENEGKVKCKLCGISCSLGVGNLGAMSGLNRQLENKHPVEFSKEKEKVAELNSKKRKASSNTYFGPCPKSLKTSINQGASSSSTVFSQQTLSDSLKRSEEKKNGWAADSPKAIDLDIKVAKWIVLSNSPFTAVENESLKVVFTTMEPRYNMPGRKKDTRNYNRKSLHISSNASRRNCRKISKYIPVTTQSMHIYL